MTIPIFVGIFVKEVVIYLVKALLPFVPQGFVYLWNWGWQLRDRRVLSEFVRKFHEKHKGEIDIKLIAEALRQEGIVSLRHVLRDKKKNPILMTLGRNGNIKDYHLIGHPDFPLIRVGCNKFKSPEWVKAEKGITLTAIIEKETPEYVLHLSIYRGKELIEERIYIEDKTTILEGSVLEDITHIKGYRQKFMGKKYSRKNS